MITPSIHFNTKPFHYIQFNLQLISKLIPDGIHKQQQSHHSLFCIQQLFSFYLIY